MELQLMPSWEEIAGPITEYSWDETSKFWRKTMNVPGGCIFWTGKYNHNGYGVFYIRGMYRLAHRISLELKLSKPIGKGKLALHKCYNKQCVNPAHLEEGSASQNNFDTWSAGTKYKIGPEKRAMLLAEVRSGGSIPKVCKKYGVNRNWVADHQRLVRLGKRQDS